MSDAADLRAEWERFSSDWIARCETKGDGAREGLLDDWMLEVVGDVDGREVIDLGCGEGRFSRMLAARGARTLGIDLQPVFVDYATNRAGPSETYAIGDLQSLDAVADDRFDLAVAYLTLVDVPDQAAAIREAFRVLRPGGRYVVCNLSPMATAPKDVGPWCRDAAGEKRHYVLDDYADEGARTVVFGPEWSLTNFHRMLSTTVNDFLDAGFELVRIHEPLPTPEQLARVPENDDLFRVPIFTIYDLSKPV
jgi:ubiquinone/menaquinone biosynthesis C-methylase UbiE